MVLNRPVLAQKLQGVGFSRDEVATMFAFKRSLKEITAFSRGASVWCRQYHMTYWQVTKSLDRIYWREFGRCVWCVYRMLR
jgi:hypothetical protein